MRDNWRRLGASSGLAGAKSTGTKLARGVRLGIFALACGLVPLAGSLLSSYQLSLGVSVGIGALLSISWGLLLLTGQVSLGHAAYVGVGAYVVGILFPRVGLAMSILAILLGGVVCGLVGLLVALGTVRMAPWVYAIVTLAVAETLRIAADQMRWLTNGAEGIFLRGPISNNRLTGFIVVWLLVVLCFAASMQFRRGRWYYYFNAVRLGARPAAMAGIPVQKVRAIASTVSGFIAGLAGGVYGYHLGFIVPVAAFDLHWSIVPQVYTLLGGIFTIAGPLVGAFVGGAVVEFTRTQLGHLHLIAYGAILVLFMLFLPQGLVGRLRTAVHRHKSIPEGGVESSHTEGE